MTIDACRLYKIDTDHRSAIVNHQHHLAIIVTSSPPPPATGHWSSAMFVYAMRLWTCSTIYAIVVNFICAPCAMPRHTPPPYASDDEDVRTSIRHQFASTVQRCSIQHITICLFNHQPVSPSQPTSTLPIRSSTDDQHRRSLANKANNRSTSDRPPTNINTQPDKMYQIDLTILANIPRHRKIYRKDVDDA